MEYNRRQQRTNKRMKEKSTLKCMATNESGIRDVRVWLLTLPLIISSYYYCVDASDSDNMCPSHTVRPKRTNDIAHRCLDLCLYFLILEMRVKRSSHSMALLSVQCSCLAFIVTVVTQPSAIIHCVMTFDTT